MADPKDPNIQPLAQQNASTNMTEQPAEVEVITEEEAMELAEEGGAMLVAGSVEGIPEPVQLRRPIPQKKKKAKPSGKKVKLEVVRAIVLHEGRLLTPGFECDIAEELKKQPKDVAAVGMIIEGGHVVEVAEELEEELCQKYAGPYAFHGQRRTDVKRYEIVRCRPYVARSKKRA